MAALALLLLVAMPLDHGLVIDPVHHRSAIGVHARCGINESLFSDDLH